MGGNIMIREILKENGIEPKLLVNDKVDGWLISFFEIEGYTCPAITFKIEQAYENVCRGYIFENGFKQSWFNERIQEVFSRWSLVCDVLEQLIVNNLNPYEEDIKLIAWIYANNIKIIA
jgi:hypothetical protein